MSKLIYITNTSLDGFVEDDTGSFNWLKADDVHQFITDLIRPFGPYLYGRRLYETMAYWGAPMGTYSTDQRAFAEVWQQSEKIVFSRRLTGVTTPNTRVERDFTAEAIRALKRESVRDIGIGGAELAGVAFAADLVDECHLFLYPIIVGRGKPAFPATLRRPLELMDTRRFGSGVVHVRYRVRDAVR